MRSSPPPPDAIFFRADCTSMRCGNDGSGLQHADHTHPAHQGCAPTSLSTARAGAAVAQRSKAHCLLHQLRHSLLGREASVRRAGDADATSQQRASCRAQKSLSAPRRPLPGHWPRARLFGNCPASHRAPPRPLEVPRCRFHPPGWPLGKPHPRLARLAQFVICISEIAIKTAKRGTWRRSSRGEALWRTNILQSSSTARRQQRLPKPGQVRAKILRRSTRRIYFAACCAFAAVQSQPRTHPAPLETQPC